MPTATVTNTPTRTNTAPNLVAWWKLDEGSGLSAMDGSGNGHTGFLIGGPLWSSGLVCCL